MKQKNAILFFSLVFLSLAAAACRTLPSGQGSSGFQNSQPDWISNPYLRYNSREYIAVVGSGNSRQDAERNALANLIAYFGQSIQVDEVVSTTYQEAVRDRTSVWSEVTTADTVISLSSSMDNLIGAEIGEAWSGSGIHYVTAILNRSRAAAAYTEMIRANQAIIENLTGIPVEERNTFSGYSRFQLAAAIADVNASYADILQQIGWTVEGASGGGSLRLEAAEIKSSIPVRITVLKESHVDSADRIETAFARALSDLGFFSGGENSRYVLEVIIVLNPVSIANSPYSWARIEMNASLIDTFTKALILPYNVTSRDGHTTQAEADNRAVLEAERRINNEYAALLNDYISGLLPGF